MDPDVTDAEAASAIVAGCVKTAPEDGDVMATVTTGE